MIIKVSLFQAIGIITFAKAWDCKQERSFLDMPYLPDVTELFIMKNQISSRPTYRTTKIGVFKN